MALHSAHFSDPVRNAGVESPNKGKIDVCPGVVYEAEKLLSIVYICTLGLQFSFEKQPAVFDYI